MSCGCCVVFVFFCFIVFFVYYFLFFFFNDTATTEIYTLSLHDALSDLRVGRASTRGTLGPSSWLIPCSNGQWGDATLVGLPLDASQVRNQTQNDSVWGVCDG